VRLMGEAMKLKRMIPGRRRCGKIIRKGVEEEEEEIIWKEEEERFDERS